MLNLAAKLGEKLSAFIGEKNGFGVDLSSPSLKEASGYFTHHRLSSLLPYRSYDPHKQLFFNDDSVGFVLECSPLVGCTEEMQREISGLFQFTLPEGSNTQFILWADPKIEPWFDRWKAPRLIKSGLFSLLAEQRTNYLRSLVFNPDNPTIIRDFRCVIAYSQKLQGTPVEQDKLIILREQVLAAFKGLGSPVHVWKADDLIKF